MNKKNQLDIIQTSKDKLELQLIRVKYELNQEIKKLEKKKKGLNEDL